MRSRTSGIGVVTFIFAASVTAMAQPAAANCGQSIADYTALIRQFKALAGGTIRCDSQTALNRTRRIVSVLEQSVAAARKVEVTCTVIESPRARVEWALSRYRGFASKCTGEVREGEKISEELRKLLDDIAASNREWDEKIRAAEREEAARQAEWKKEQASKVERTNRVSKAMYASTGASIFNCGQKPLWNAAAWDAECRRTASSSSSRTVVRVVSSQAVHRWGIAACGNVAAVYQRLRCIEVVRTEIMLYQAPAAKAGCGHLSKDLYAVCVRAYFNASLSKSTNESAAPSRTNAETDTCPNQPPAGKMQRYFPDPDREQWFQRAKARCQVPQNQAYDAQKFRSCVDTAKAQILIDDDRIVSHECRGLPDQQRCVDDALQKGIEVGVRMCAGGTCPPTRVGSCDKQRTIQTPQRMPSLMKTIRDLVDSFSRVPRDDEKAGTPGSTTASPNAGTSPTATAAAGEATEPTPTERDEIYCSYVADRLRNRDPNFSRPEQIQPECMQMSLIRDLLAAQSGRAPSVGDDHPDLSGLSSESKHRQVIDRLVQEAIQLR